MSENEKNGPEKDDEDEGKGFELFAGLVLALFAAVLAITDLYAGKYGDDEREAQGEKNNQYSWYQSKDTKKTQQDMQKILYEAELRALKIQEANQSTFDKILTSTAKPTPAAKPAKPAKPGKDAKPDAAAAPASAPAAPATPASASGDLRAELEKKVQKIDAKIRRYEIEKEIIMNGARKMPAEKMDELKKIDEQSYEEMKAVYGAKEWEAKTGALGGAGDLYDLATLFLQMCLVLGAIALVLQQKALKTVFAVTMILLGLSGSFYTYRALTASWEAAALME